MLIREIRMKIFSFFSRKNRKFWFYTPHVRDKEAIILKKSYCTCIVVVVLGAKTCVPVVSLPVVVHPRLPKHTSTSLEHIYSYCMSPSRPLEASEHIIFKTHFHIRFARKSPPEAFEIIIWRNTISLLKGFSSEIKGVCCYTYIIQKLSLKGQGHEIWFG